MRKLELWVDTDMRLRLITIASGWMRIQHITIGYVISLL